MKNIGENVVRIEAEALRALADRIAGPMAAAFQRAVDLMFSCAGRVVVTGMGKSGLIARKIAATLSSTGTPALYLHPVEALHGDLGMVVRGDVVLALSASGETEEILALLATIKRLQVPLIAMTGDEVWGLQHRARQVKAADECPLSTAKCIDSCRGGGRGSGLFDRGGGLLAGAGADGFDDDDAGAGRCAGGYAQREARIQGRRFCQPASGRKVGEAAGAGGIADAHRRCAAAGDAADEDAGRDL